MPSKLFPFRIENMAYSRMDSRLIGYQRDLSADYIGLNFCRVDYMFYNEVDNKQIIRPVRAGVESAFMRGWSQPYQDQGRSRRC